MGAGLNHLVAVPIPNQALGNLAVTGGRRERDGIEAQGLLRRHDLDSFFVDIRLDGRRTRDGPAGVGLGLEVGIGALVDLAEQAAVGPRTADRVAVLVVDRRQNVGVRNQAAERSLGVVSAQLGVPPTARAPNGLRRDGGLDVGAHADATTTRLDPAPVTILDAELFSEFGMDGEVRLGSDVANRRHVEVLGVVVRHRRATSGERDRILFEQLRMVVLVLATAMVLGHRRVTELFEDRRLELELAGLRAEAVLLVLLEVLRREEHAVLLDELVVARNRITERFDDVVVDVFLGLPRPILGVLTASEAQFLPERVLVMTIVQRLHGTLRALDGVGGTVVGVHDGTLESASRREDVIGIERCRSHPVFDSDQELAALKSLEDHLGVAVAALRVSGANDEAADPVRIARDDGLEDARAMCFAEPLGGHGLAPCGNRGVSNLAVAGPRGELEEVGADLLGLLLFRKQLVELELLVGEERHRRTGDEVATRAVEVAGQSAHDGAGMGTGNRVGAELVPRAAPLDVGGLVHGVHASSLADVLGVEPRDGGSPLGRVLLEVIHDGVETVAVVDDKVEVNHAFVADGVCHGQRERRVGARTQRQPQVCILGSLGVTRVDDDDLQAVELKVSVTVHARKRGCAWVHAPENDAAGAAEVGLKRRPTAHGRLDHERRNPAQQRVVEAVRRTEDVEETTASVVVRTSGAASGGNCLGAALFFDLVEPLGNLADALVPWDLFPLVFALGARALQAVVDARRMMHVLESTRAAAAQTTLVGVVGIAFDLDDFAIFHVSEDATICVAEVACALLHLYTGSMDIDLRHMRSPLLFRLPSRTLSSSATPIKVSPFRAIVPPRLTNSNQDPILGIVNSRLYR